jgi:hypothetical protein
VLSDGIEGSGHSLTSGTLTVIYGEIETNHDSVRVSVVLVQILTRQGVSTQFGVS